MWEVQLIFSLLLLCHTVQYHRNEGSVTLDAFFPFGSEAGDTLFGPNDDSSFGPIILPHVFPYFDNNHRNIYQANNGLFSFLGPIPTYSPIVFPLGYDQRLITAFWADIDTRGYTGNLSDNKVYHHVHVRDTSNMTNITSSVLDRVSSFVRLYFPRESAFQPVMAIVGTWYRVGYYNSNTDKLNTFQMVLATDESRSFVFFLYNTLEWVGNSMNESYAQAGFNAGDGINFRMLQYSRTANVSLLVNESNVNVPGLFAFRIDTTDIETGGCGENNTRQHSPMRGPQIGGTGVSLQGPCFLPNISRIICQFGEFGVSNGIVLNEYRAVCVSPLAFYATTIELNVSIDEGHTFLSWGSFTYMPTTDDVFAEEEIVVRKNGTSDMFISWNDTIQVEWVFPETILGSLPSDAVVEIDYQIIQGNENRTSQAQLSPWSDINVEVQQAVILASNLRPQAGRQTMTIDLNNITISSSRILPAVGVGVVRVAVVIYRGYKIYRTVKRIVRTIQQVSRIGCNLWSANEEDPSTWNTDLPPCPNTLRQANVARADYQPDTLCRQGGLPLVNCWFHRGRSQYNEESASACFRSVQSNRHGAAAQCCYNEGGQLITRGTGAGTDDRYHSGQTFWKHQLHDVLSFLACCKIQSDPDTCDDYLDRRPPRAGSDTRGQFGGTWGDPHFTTLDGTSYTFNGYGEYIYLAVPSEPSIIFDPNSIFQFESQIRTTPLPNVTNGVTAVRGFAARGGSIIVSITVSRRNQLIVRLNDEDVTFDSDQDQSSVSETITLRFGNFSMTKNTSSNQMTLVWNMGVSIQVTPVLVSTASMVVLNVAAAVSGTLKGNWTLGLIGSYDGNTQNDLRLKNGTVIGTVDNLSSRQIHELFGVTWAISPNSSLFYYETHENASFYQYQNLNYTANFEDPANGSLQVNILSGCGIPLNSTNSSQWSNAQRTCYYDASITGDLAFGVSSRQAAEEQSAYRESLLNPPRFNEYLTLKRTVQSGELVNISFQAVSEFTMSIDYKLLNGPNGSILDQGTGQFRWKVPEEFRNGTEVPVKVSATDRAKNLTSSYEILLQVESSADGGEANSTVTAHTTSTATVSTSSITSMITNGTSYATNSSTTSTNPTTTQSTSMPVSTAATITSGSTISITLDSSSPKFRRIGGISTDYYYHTTLINIPQNGLYTFTSTSNIATNGFIYTNYFDPQNASANVLAEDYGNKNNGRYAISVSLQATNGASRRLRTVRASATYYLVTTTKDPGATGPIQIKLIGPNSNGGQTDNRSEGDKIVGIIIGCTIGGLLIIACCFTLCVSGILYFSQSRKGNYGP